ncbi:DUF4407 domain-containing protein [Saccharopolyspora sp. NPDC050389]|uniref:DUF4407 domain-containing protein n=1 Tax=Saccharopolyspora sp. NPDC050389 TaxID=3155516 RepID=UPI0033E5978F
MTELWKTTSRRVWNRMRSADYGRKLRVLAGTDENTLDWVPHNRTRYTGVGGVVLSTAVIAGLSMTFALSQVLGGFSPLLLLPALLWTVVVLNLDRWLISSATDTRWGRRTAMLVPRLLVAGLLGFIIAEPVVLRLFQTAVEQHINDERDRQVRELVDGLVRCNPLPGGPQPPGVPSDCTGKVFSIGIEPTALARELAATEQQVVSLSSSIRTDSEQLANLENLARLECTGAAGPGLTGVPGEGSDCRRLRREADEFRTSHPIETRSAELSTLNSRVAELRDRAGSTQRDYQQARDAEIQRQRAELENHQREIGLLERFRALDDMTGQNPVLWGATWLIRLMFVLIDCLPILVKLLGGTTAYDRLVETRTASNERIYTEVVQNTEETVLGELALRRHEKLLDLQKRRERADLDMRRHDAGITEEINETIAAVAARMAPEEPGRTNGHSVAGV